MIYEVKPSALKEVEPGAHYNLCPPGWAPLTEKEFVRERFDQPKYIEHRQVYLNKDGTASGRDYTKQLNSISLFWIDQWYGYAMSTNYYPGTVHYFKFGFTTEEVAELIKKELPPVEKDSSWNTNTSTSIPIRGITDWWRKITFKQELTRKELSKVCEWLRKDGCPGYTRIGHQCIGKATYRFTTTYDSSD